MREYEEEVSARRLFEIYQEAIATRALSSVEPVKEEPYEFTSN